MRFVKASPFSLYRGTHYTTFRRIDLLYCAYMKKTSIVLAVLAIIVLVVAVGYNLYTTMQAQKAQLAQQDETLKYYPKPADVIKNSGGTVASIFGALVNVETNDPADYLPHTDGTPVKRLTTGLNVTKNTQITIVTLSTGGTSKAAKLSDIKVGDSVRYWTDSNIRTTQLVDATMIQIIR